jgi:hypothetical protein
MDGGLFQCISRVWAGTSGASGTRTRSFRLHHVDIRGLRNDAGARASISRALAQALMRDQAAMPRMLIQPKSTGEWIAGV